MIVTFKNIVSIDKNQKLLYDNLHESRNIQDILPLGKMHPHCQDF